LDGRTRKEHVGGCGAWFTVTVPLLVPLAKVASVAVTMGVKVPAVLYV
jgi:hypothetical protein